MAFSESVQSNNRTAIDGASPSAGEGSPKQRHAGQVGLGPGLRGPGLDDKVVGLKEQVQGKLTRNPELVQHGKDRGTGELKMKELEEDAKSGNPFETAGSEKPPLAPHKSGNEASNTKSSHHIRERTDEENYDAARMVAPEGTAEGDAHRRSHAASTMKHIGGN